VFKVILQSGRLVNEANALDAGSVGALSSGQRHGWFNVVLPELV